MRKKQIYMNSHIESCIKHLVSLAVLFSIVVLSLCGCESDQDVEIKYDESETAPDNNMQITIMHCYNPEEYNRLSHIIFDGLKEKWIETHPEIQLNESVLFTEVYGDAITSYASQESLPDTFLLSPVEVKIWSDWGFTADATEYLNKSEASGERMIPVLQDGKAYAFNTLFSSPVLIAYDISAWKAAGYDRFPKTWEELTQAINFFNDEKYDSPLGISELTGSNVATYLMPRLLLENCGMAWMDRLLSGEESGLFLENGVADVLEELHWIYDSGTLKEYDYPVEAYLENQCPAVMITPEEFPELMKNMEKWKSTAFALIPTSAESKYGKDVANTYFAVESYALAINSKTTEDSAKMNACVDFCRFITDNANEKYETEYLKSAETTAEESLSTLLNKSEKVPNYIYYIDRSFLIVIYNEIETWLGADVNSSTSVTVEEIANSMQNGYEKYLNWDYR